MATLERSLDPKNFAPNGSSLEPGSWGLLLIPVLVCITMLIYALDAKAPPAPNEVPVSRSCASPNQPRPSGAC